MVKQQRKIIRNKIATASLWLVASLFLAKPSIAQESCLSAYELIFDIAPAPFGAYNIWDTLYGEESHDEEFTSGILLSNDQTFTAGRRLYKDGSGKRTLILAEIDLRGRIVWDKEIEIKGLKQVNKILKAKTGYMVLVTVKTDAKSRETGKLIFLNDDMSITHQITLSEKGADFTPHDITRSWTGDGYLLVASVFRKSQNTTDAIFMRLNEAGNVTKQRTHRPGSGNILVSINQSGERYYITAGYTKDAQDRVVGWAMQINDDGSIVWQTQYPRGAASRLLSAAPFPGSRIVVTGQALPLDQGPSAGWVMMLDQGSGEPLWQRFYRSEQNNSARDVVVSGDLMSVIINSSPVAERKKPMEEEDADSGSEESMKTSEEESQERGPYARLLTINPRGVLFLTQDYFNAAGVSVSQLFNGPRNEPIMLGHSKVLHHIEGEGASADLTTTQESLESWALAAPIPDKYEDPCKEEKPQKGISSSAGQMDALFP